MVHASELQSGKRDERYPQQFVLWVPRRRGTLRDDAEELSVLPLSLCVMEMILLPPRVLPPTPQGAWAYQFIKLFSIPDSLTSLAVA